LPLGGFILPFLLTKHRVQDAGVSQIIGPKKEESSNESDSLHLVAKEMIRAFEAKDAMKLAMALRDAFSILDAEPHVEGEHLNQEE